MLEKERRGDPYPGGEAAGRASCLEVCLADVLCLGKGKALPGALEKIPGNILAALGEHPGPADQDSMAVAAVQICGRTRGGQTA